MSSGRLFDRFRLAEATDRKLEVDDRSRLTDSGTTCHQGGSNDQTDTARRSPVKSSVDSDRQFELHFLWST